MFLGRGLVTVGAGAAAALALAGGLAVTDTQPGEIGPSLGMTANGRKLDPVGRLTQVGNFPTGSALTKDGRYLWVVDSGHGSDDVRVVSVASGQVIQTLPLPGGAPGDLVPQLRRRGRRRHVIGGVASRRTTSSSTSRHGVSEQRLHRLGC
jgi:hypothetical protein